MVASATAMKFSGVGLLATRTPRRVAAGMSILSVPMKGTITSLRRGEPSKTRALTRSRDEGTRTSTSRQASTSSASLYGWRAGWSSGRPTRSSWPASTRG